MVVRASQSGSVLLPAIVLVLLLAAGSFFVVARQKSASIVGNEAEARRVLTLLAEAQHERFLETGGYAALATLLDRDARDDARMRLRSILGETVGPDEVLLHAGYCFVVILVDQAGFECRVESDDLNREFFIAYAWPENFGETGRRVFVIDHEGALRACANRLPGEQSYSGTEEAPPGQLAPPPEGREYPFTLKRVGAQKTLVWKPMTRETGT